MALVYIVKLYGEIEGVFANKDDAEKLKDRLIEEQTKDYGSCKAYVDEYEVK